MPTLFRQLSWFVVIGCTAAAVHWSTVVLVVRLLHLAPLLANLAGWLVAFAFSFAGHRHFTFRHAAQIPWTATLRRFFVVSAAGFAVNECTYAWLLHRSGLRYDVLLAFVLIGIAGLTFVASRLWAFRHRRRA